MDRKDQLLEKTMGAIRDKALQSGTFADSCSITGNDFEYCIFCGETNRENPSVPVQHEETCVYLDAERYFSKRDKSAVKKQAAKSGLADFGKPVKRIRAKPLQLALNNGAKLHAIGDAIKGQGGYILETADETYVVSEAVLAKVSVPAGAWPSKSKGTGANHRSPFGPGA